MVDTVIQMKLPVDERYKIEKNRIISDKMKNRRKRVCVLTGIDGEQLQGQYTCYALTKKLEGNIQSVCGIVDIYPAVNPLSLSGPKGGHLRVKKTFDSIFPGNPRGTADERIADALMNDIAGADLCIYICDGGNTFFELPYAVIDETVTDTILPFAQLLNTEFVWIKDPEEISDASLYGSLNIAGVPTLSVHAGSSFPISESVGDQIVDGIIRILSELDMWEGVVPMVKNPAVSNNGTVIDIRSEYAGAFYPYMTDPGRFKYIIKGDIIGTVFNPSNSMKQNDIFAPCNGIMISLRYSPVVTKGTLLARMYKAD